MEDRFHDGLQVPLDDFLGNPVRDRRNPQWSGFCLAIALRTIDPPNRWRKVAPRSQSVPELVEVVRKTSLKVRNRLPIYSSRPLVGLHTLEGFPNLPFRDLERLCLVHSLLPLPDGLS